MRARQSIAVLVAFLLIFVLAACTAAQPFDAGTPLTPSEAAALQSQLENERQNTNDAEGEKGDDTNIPSNGIVFWLDSGTVYHLKESCYHIANKDNVRSGTVAQAIAASKQRACSACSAD